MIDFKELVKAGVHFGHTRSRWNPNMEPYIWGYKNNVHLIDVSKTAFNLEKAAKFIEKITAEGKPVLWVGTKKPAQTVITSTAKKLKMPFVTHRWIGGTLSNFPQVKKSVTKLLHFEDILAKAEKYPLYTKKELNTIQKNVERLKKNVGGIVNLKWPIGAIVLVDIKKESSALKEALVKGVPIIALVDTNSDPSFVDYVIPANDDSPRSIECITNYLAAAAEKGIAVANEKKKEKDAQEAAERELKRKAREAKAIERKAEAKAKIAPKATAKKEAHKKVAKPKVEEKKAAKETTVKKDTVKATPKKVAKTTSTQKAAPKKAEAKAKPAPKATAKKETPKKTAKPKVEEKKVAPKKAAKEKTEEKKAPAKAKKSTADKK